MAYESPNNDLTKPLLDPTRDTIQHADHHEIKKNTDSALFKFLVTCGLIMCGAGMTLIIKMQDEFCISNCPDEEGHLSDPGSDNGSSGSGHLEPHNFHQPFIQLFQMGLGQLTSILFFKMYEARPDENGVTFRRPTFKEFFPSAAAASVFDALAEVFVILGLALTLASTAEMMKATLVVFCGLFSLRFFPGFKLSYKQWISTFVMLAGAAVVITSPYLGTGSDNALEEVGGACLVLLAQLFYAGQFIVEERLVDMTKIRQTHVNKAVLVFCEGIVSICAAIILQIPWCLIVSGWDGFAHDIQVYFSEPMLWASGIGLSFAVAGFDLFGLATAETMGSDRRAVVTASFQVVIVWTLSIFIGWEDFYFVPLIGFILIFLAGLGYSFSATAKEAPRHFGIQTEGALESEGEEKDVSSVAINV